jgi:DNA-binding NtrC family response regulator
MAQEARILVVDDEVAARTALAELLREEGYVAETAGDGFKALARIEESAPDLLLLDLRMPSMDGFELMRRLRREEIHIPVVVMSAFGSVQTALDAMREGALDFVVKPLDAEQLLAVVDRALRGRQSSAGTTPTPPLPLPDMVCQSSEMQHLSRVAQQVAPSRATVLIVGERGSGRERLARALHSLSKRAQHPFVRLDCADLADQWADDVPRMREEIQTAVRSARSGTLYLREVQELPIAGQAALLDFLPPVSADTSGQDIRLIASTDCDLRAMVAGGHFRSDLALILHVVTLHLPALRERRADIIPLAEQLIAERANGHDRRISPELRKYLESRVWFGNVKELDESIQEAFSRATNGPLSVDHFGHAEGSDLEVAPTIPGASLSDIERYAILKTLQAQGGSTSRAARILGISVRKIQYKLHEYGFSRLRSGSDSDAS